MSDAKLQDIGLSRGDLDAAGATPGDPTEELARIRRDHYDW